jgi:cardiolipin synthase C
LNSSHAFDQRLRLVAGIGLLALTALLTGCAGALPQVTRVPSQARIATAEAPLVEAARAATISPGGSGVWPLMQGSFALDARLAMIENARDSIDLQYYLIANDSTGRSILRALRDAAERGVRVRLLVDDLYTSDLHNLLAGLAATANVEVRLFNPVVTDRASASRRLLAMVLDFKRLNHRMHNKLFIVDGAMAIVGGRNLADEYFLRGTENNFIDFDVLLAGSVVPELSGWFDLYWNSTAVFPLQDIERAAASNTLPADVARAAFDNATRNDARPNPPIAPDFFGAPSLSAGLAQCNLSVPKWLPSPTRRRRSTRPTTALRSTTPSPTATCCS